MTTLINFYTYYNIFFISDMFNRKMTQNNFHVIIILIHIKIYTKFITPPRSAALFTIIQKIKLKNSKSNTIIFLLNSKYDKILFLFSNSKKNMIIFI